MGPSRDDKLPLASLPLHCPYCGRPFVIDYEPAPHAEVSVTCPYTDCVKVTKVGGAGKILAVRADPLRQ